MSYVILSCVYDFFLHPLTESTECVIQSFLFYVTQKCHIEAPRSFSIYWTWNVLPTLSLSKQLMFFPYVYSGQVGQTRDMLGGRFSCWNPPGDIPPHTRTGKPCRGRNCRSCNGSSRAEARRFSCRFSVNIRPSAQSTGLTGDRGDQQSQSTEEER